jgi:hypothetical protein
MLAASRVLVARPDDVTYLHVIKEGVIISNLPGDWGTGPLLLAEHDESSATVSRAVETSAVSAELRKLVGMRLRLFKDRRPICEATVTGTQSSGYTRGNRVHASPTESTRCTRCTQSPEHKGPTTRDRIPPRPGDLASTYASLLPL